MGEGRRGLPPEKVAEIRPQGVLAGPSAGKGAENPSAGCVGRTCRRKKGRKSVRTLGGASASDCPGLPPEKVPKIRPQGVLPGLTAGKRGGNPSVRWGGVRQRLPGPARGGRCGDGVWCGWGAEDAGMAFGAGARRNARAGGRCGGRRKVRGAPISPCARGTRGRGGRWGRRVCGRCRCSGRGG